jgi:putative SOS response-associated peptidase YedK
MERLTPAGRLMFSICSHCPGADLSTMTAVRTHPLNPDQISIRPERGRAVMVVRRHPQSGVPGPDYLTWGLIPHDAETRPDNQPMNARAETIREKRMFRDAYRKRRAVVPIDAFQQKDAKGKLHTIKRADGEPLAIAAIWENWQSPETGRWERTFATLTVAANAAVAPVHDRMPLVLEKKDIERWLGTEEDPRELLQPSADDVLQVVATGKRPRRP